MEKISVEIEERGGLICTKKELGGRAPLLLNGEDYFEMKERMLDVQK